MATAKQYSFTFKEIAALLVKDAGVKEGHWGVSVKFGLQGTNVGMTEDDLRPAAIVAMLELGLQQFDTPNGLTVDAAVVNSKK